MITSMTRRDLVKRALFVPPAVAVSSCATVADLALRSQYLIRTDQILGQLLPYFPFQQQYQGIGQLSLSNPVFSMAPELNKVRIGLTTSVSAASTLGEMTGIPELGRIAGRSSSGTCQVACGLRYDSETRGIYLRDPAIEKFEFDRLSSTFTKPLQQIINLIGPRMLDRRPIHTLEPSLATRFLNSMVVQPGGIALKFRP